MTTFRIITEFEIPDDALASDGIEIIRSARNEVRLRSPEGWKATTRFDFPGVEVGDEHSDAGRGGAVHQGS
jgi:hypothetical protein